MKNTFSIFALIAVMIAALACGGSSTPPPSPYVGVWTGADGTYLAIRGDGSADYKAGSSHITGGTAVIDEAAKSLKISFASFGPTFTIDKPPAGDQMTLSGVVYKKGAGSPTTSATTASEDSPADPPSREEADKLIKVFLTSFTKGVQDGAFDDFYEKSSEQWKDTYTLDQTNDLFRSFVEKKADVLPSLRDAAQKTARLSEVPGFKEQEGVKLLVLKGDFPSKPYSVTFETQYLWQEGRWKIKKFKIDL